MQIKDRKWWVVECPVFLRGGKRFVCHFHHVLGEVQGKTVVRLFLTLDANGKAYTLQPQEITEAKKQLVRRQSHGDAVVTHASDELLMEDRDVIEAWYREVLFAKSIADSVQCAR